MEIAVPDEPIEKAVLKAVKKYDLVPREDLLAYRPSLESVRKDYFCNHSKWWNRNLIFDRFPETQGYSFKELSRWHR